MISATAAGISVHTELTTSADQLARNRPVVPGDTPNGLGGRFRRTAVEIMSASTTKIQSSVVAAFTTEPTFMLA